MHADDPLLRWRERFPITQRANYLISNSLRADGYEVVGNPFALGGATLTSWLSAMRDGAGLV